ncbi:MAG: ferritin-like domain-containing protein, partial [Actinomycetota bacterium]
PLLKKLLRYVMSDEARHVAFGVLSLQEYYSELTEAELFERQEFAYDAAVRMRDRFQRQEIWERFGIDVKEAIRTFSPEDPNEDPFQQLLFAKIVPNCKKLGLLEANDGWLRKRFEEMHVIQFEDAMDTEAEYELLDAVTADREQEAEAS